MTGRNGKSWCFSVCVNLCEAVLSLWSCMWNKKRMKMLPYFNLEETKTVQWVGVMPILCVSVCYGCWQWSWFCLGFFLPRVLEIASSKDWCLPMQETRITDFKWPILWCFFNVFLKLSVLKSQWCLIRREGQWSHWIHSTASRILIRTHVFWGRADCMLLEQWNIYHCIS